MHLTVLLPTRVEVDRDVDRIAAEGDEGSFTILPRHIDIACSLRPGLLSFDATGGEEVFLAVDGGLLVKCGGQVRVSTPRAVRGSLGELTRAVAEQFRRLSERQEQALAAAGKMQADFVRRFIELQQNE